MSLIARIQYVNFLTYSNPDSRDRKPALRVVEFSPLKYSTAINIPNGHGKTNMISALLYLLSRDRKLKEKEHDVLSLFTPRRSGAPSHIRVQLWDLRDDLAQTDLGLEEGLLDPRDLPNKGDHHVFGMCAYQGDEPRFYYYKGVLEDCPAFERTDTGYLYRHESDIRQSVTDLKDQGGNWNISSTSEWRTLITSHIPGRVLDQQVKFHLAGGGDKSAQLHQIETDPEEFFDQAFFRTVIAPELLASTEDPDDDTAESRENFEDLLYTHFTNMASATIRAEQEQQLVQQQEAVVRDLGGLVSAGEKAKESHDKYHGLIAAISRDGAAVRHLVQTDPFPGLLDARQLPPGRVGEIAPYIVIDKVHGAMILDAGLEKLTNVEPGNLNRTADRNRIQRVEVDNTQVVDFAWNLVNFKSGNRGGGYSRKGYTLDTALALIPLLREIGTAKLAGASDTLQQAFGWVESTADTNRYRKEARRLSAEIRQHQEDIKQRKGQIEQWEAEAKILGERITKYDHAKGAYEDLAKSGYFTQEELEAPALLTNKVAGELRLAEEALAADERRVGRLEKTFAGYMAFCQDNPGVSVRARLDELTAKANGAIQALSDAEQRLQQSKGELARLDGLKSGQEERNRADQKQLDGLLELQSHRPTYVEWFGDTPSDTIDIRGNLKKITIEETALAQRRQEREKLRDGISALLPSVPRFHELFGDDDAASIDISGELQKIAYQENELEKERAGADALHARILGLKPFVETFRRIFGDADPEYLDPTKERADLQQSIALAETTTKSLEAQVAKLALFRSTYPGWTAAAWLVDMESRRYALTQEIAQCNQQILTADRQIAELMSDPVARPEDVASAHALIDGAVPFVPLHNFIEEHCPSGVKQHWLTHFSALLFAPVVETIEAAAEAARLLHDGPGMMPVLIASRLMAMMESETPALALDGECAYTWLAGIKTRMVHCLLNPEVVEEERSLAWKRLEELRNTRTRKQEELDGLSEKSESVLLARDAERAETSNAEAELVANSERLEQLRIQLPDVLVRCASEALDSIQKTREYLVLLKEHGEDLFERVVEELRRIGEKAALLRQSRSWYEERNSDPVRKVIMDMRRYHALLAEHGVDVLQKVQEELTQIEEEVDDLRRSRVWYEARDRDDIHAAVNAMQRYLQAGGDIEVARLQGVVDAGNLVLSALAEKIAEATQAVTEDEGRLSTARTEESNAAAAYNQSKQYLEDLASFAESEDLTFMDTHEECRATLDANKSRAEARKSYESQFAHAQRYIDETRDSQSSEQELLNHKAGLEAKAEEAKRLQDQDSQTADEKNGKHTALRNHQDALHEAACRLLSEFRAVSKSLDDIHEAVNEGAPRFENTDLYLHADSIRARLERADEDPFLMDGIRKVGRLAGDLGLAEQSKDIERARSDADRLANLYKGIKASFCGEIIKGTRKGLSVLTAEWLQNQERFDAATEMKAQIEASIEKNKELLEKATDSLEFARDKTTEMLTLLAKDAERALLLLEEAMATTSTSRFYVSAEVIAEEKIGKLLDSLYSNIEGQMRRHADSGSIATEKRQRKRVLDDLRSEVYRSLFTDVSVEFRHPSIWEGGQHRLTAKGLSEGMKTAISLMWIAKLAEFRLRQAIDQSGGMKRQKGAALRKERYFVILDGLFSNLSHDDMIDSAMESLRLSAGHFQLIGMIHHPRYINNPKIFPSYFVGRPYRATGGKHTWLTVEPEKNVPGSLGVFGSHFTQ